ncbi:MAG TPA: CoA-binding protein [Intrasporangiaceae bacterium]|nr:CoA-binding protein [Intrasporangiaceae bacterium]
MAIAHQNDPDLIAQLLADPGTWVIVGLSQNTRRTAHRVAQWLQVEQNKRIIPVHPRAEEVFGEQGYATLADLPDQDIKVVDCFVNSDLVGDIVDQAIEQRDRLSIDAVWMQLGVVDEDAADRARAAGLGVIMDTCPKIEARRLGSLGAVR